MTITDSSELSVATGSALDVAAYPTYVEFRVDGRRPIGSESWLRIDREHFVSDVSAMR